MPDFLARYDDEGYQYLSFAAAYRIRAKRGEELQRGSRTR